MQNRYAGDIGDFGKFGLLKALEAQGLKVGINWYLANPPKSEYKTNGTFVQQDGKHSIKERHAICDSDLADSLNNVFTSPTRSVAALEVENLVPHATYYAKIVPQDINKRVQWHKGALAALKDCDVVFLDPDNGLAVKSVKPGEEKSVKYVFDSEVEDYLKRGISVVIYNHRHRKKVDKYFSEYAKRFTNLEADFCIMDALSFHAGSVRDYFFLVVDNNKCALIGAAVAAMLDSTWGQTGFCRRECNLPLLAISRFLPNLSASVGSDNFYSYEGPYPIYDAYYIPDEPHFQAKLNHRSKEK